MKLIDILVERLPALGGWPIDSDDERTLISSLPGVSWGLNGGGYYAFRGPNDSITYQQYEAALSASKPEWNGEGLPPVGCEFLFGTHQTKAKCIAVGRDVIFASTGNPDAKDEFYEEFVISIHHSEFRPIRSDADKKRDEAIKAIDDAQSQVFDQDSTFSEYLYDAIAAGKIPHIRID